MAAKHQCYIGKGGISRNECICTENETDNRIYLDFIHNDIPIYRERILVNHCPKCGYTPETIVEND